MDIRPIRSEEDWQAALGEIERLMSALPGTPDGDRLDVLVTLVEAYEKKTHPIAPPDPVDAILFRMDQAGLSRADLEPIIGRHGQVDRVLNRERPLTLAMIRRLTDELDIPADTLVRPYELKQRVA